MPDVRIDVGGTGPAPPASAAETVQVAAKWLRGAVEGLLTKFGADLAELPAGDLRRALDDWSRRLSEHVGELEEIAEQAQAEPLGRESAEDLGGDEETADALDPDAPELDVEGLRLMRRKLECQRSGRDDEEVTSAWADPEETAREIEELQRVRRQIRYLFGTMLSQLPDASTLRVDDLASEQGDAEEALGAGSCEEQGDTEVQTQRLPPSVQEEPERARASPAGDEKGLREPEAAGPPPTAAVPAARPAAHRAAQASPEGSVAAQPSRAAADEEAEEEERERERRRERRERRERKQRRQEVPELVVDAREPKRDGGLPRKQWNWAEEVVKASLDPQNQWEFPGPEEERPLPLPLARAVRAAQPAWEQPRQGGRPAEQRGSDIASRARERAQEVQRMEREQQRQLFGMAERAAAPRPFA